MATRDADTQVVEKEAPQDDRSRRQVEEYRKKRPVNGARSMLGALKALPSFRGEEPKATPKMDVPADVSSPRRLTDVFSVLKILNDIDYSGRTFPVQQTEEGFLISVGSKQWFVPPFVTDDEIVEVVFVACQQMLHETFLFRGKRVFPHRSDRTSGVESMLKLLTPAPAKCEIAITAEKGEVEKVVKIIQRYFKMSRADARGTVWGLRSQVVDALQVRELNGILQKRRLKTKAHMATCRHAR